MSFKSVQAGIAKNEGIPKANAGAILASASRAASPAAKKANPNLKKVLGKPKKKKSKYKKMAKAMTSWNSGKNMPMGATVGQSNDPGSDYDV